jgi:riboflavin kinase/FMN adenylyltransferase
MRQLYGIDEIIILPFTEQLMRTTWQVFLRQLLVDTYKVTHIVVGHDFHFGYREEGNGRRLRNECARLGIQCDVIPKVELDGITVSSTYIRGLVAQGDMERAQTFLGHPHVMTGIIARDKKIGRTIGYPTANLKTQPGILMPAFGSYVSRFVIAGTTYQAMTNIGIRPTFYKSDEVTIETNIFDFNQQAYDLPASVELLTRMRPEQRFSSKEDLQQQLRLDEEIARKWHLDHS